MQWRHFRQLSASMSTQHPGGLGGNLASHPKSLVADWVVSQEVRPPQFPSVCLENWFRKNYKKQLFRLQRGTVFEYHLGQMALVFLEIRVQPAGHPRLLKLLLLWSASISTAVPDLKSDRPQAICRSCLSLCEDALFQPLGSAVAPVL